MKKFALFHNRWKGDVKERRIITLLNLLADKAPKTLKINTMPQVITNLVMKTWRELPSTWVPRGKSAHTQLVSLVEHLWVQFPMPSFLFEILTRIPRASTEKDLVEFYYAVAGGFSVYKAAQILIKTPLSKKMVHRFMQTKSGVSVIQAIRETQIEAFGGCRRLALALRNTPPGRSFMFDETFWSSIIQWFCNQPMLDPQQVPPLTDYINHCKTEDLQWSIKGRTVTSMTRGMERWHHILENIKKVKKVVFEPSGSNSGRWVRGKDPSDMSVYTLTEILSTKDLAREGKKMRHCVYSYGRSIASGRTSIWSFRSQKHERLHVEDAEGVKKTQFTPLDDPEHVVTIEILNAQKKVVQAQGKMNKPPPAWAMKFVQEWASRNGLSIYTRY